MISFENGIELKNREGVVTGQTVSCFITKEFHHYPLTNESIITIISFKDLQHFTENGISAYTGEPKSFNFRKEVTENGTIPEPKSYQEAELKLLELEEFSGGQIIE